MSTIEDLEECHHHPFEHHVWLKRYASALCSRLKYWMIQYCSNAPFLISYFHSVCFIQVPNLFGIWRGSPDKYRPHTCKVLWQRAKNRVRKCAVFKVTALFKVPVMPVLLIIDIQLTIPASLLGNRVFTQDWHFLTFLTGSYPFSPSVEDLWGT